VKAAALCLLLLSLGLYGLTGFYVVGGNEKAAVRRFGRLVLPLRSSGLHYDWPFPFTRIDRINFAALQTVTVGSSTQVESFVQLGLRDVSPRAFLTGDQNLLQVQAQVLFRPVEEQVGDYLFSQVAPDVRLSRLAEAILVELISQSGVDFAHVRGLSELNERFTTRLRFAVADQRLGIGIEQAVIEQVEPPLRVKADFLDVSNARAEQARSIQEGRTWAEQKVSQAQSERQRIVDGAEADRKATTATAHGSADRFRKLVLQMHDEVNRGGSDYARVRRLAIQRLSWQTLREIWPKVRKKAVVDAEGPVDVIVFPKSP
jgi:membrane protease subunit HflK